MRAFSFLLDILVRFFYTITFWFGCSVVRPLLINSPKGKVKISPTATIKYPRNITVGRNVFINHKCCIWGSADAQIVIGDDVLMGPGVVVLSSNHGIKSGSLIRTQSESSKDVLIGSDVWIGANTVILPGAKIGDGCVIGAGCVVNKDLPSNSICVGSPAKPIGYRKND